MAGAEARVSSAALAIASKRGTTARGPVPSPSSRARCWGRVSSVACGSQKGGLYIRRWVWWVGWAVESRPSGRGGSPFFPTRSPSPPFSFPPLHPTTPADSPDGLNINGSCHCSGFWGLGGLVKEGGVLVGLGWGSGKYPHATVVKVKKVSRVG